jgi:hypothetical protein
MVVFVASLLLGGCATSPTPVQADAEPAASAEQPVHEQAAPTVRQDEDGRVFLGVKSTEEQSASDEPLEDETDPPQPIAVDESQSEPAEETEPLAVAGDEQQESFIAPVFTDEEVRALNRKQPAVAPSAVEAPPTPQSKSNPDPADKQKPAGTSPSVPAAETAKPAQPTDPVEPKPDPLLEELKDIRRQNQLLAERQRRLEQALREARRDNSELVDKLNRAAIANQIQQHETAPASQPMEPATTEPALVEKAREVATIERNNKELQRLRSLCQDLQRQLELTRSQSAEQKNVQTKLQAALRTIDQLQTENDKLSSLSSTQAERLQTLQAQQAELDKTLASLRRERREAEQLRAQQAALTEELAKLQAQAAELDTLRAQKTQLEQRLAQVTTQGDADLLAKLERQLAKQIIRHEETREEVRRLREQKKELETQLATLAPPATPTTSPGKSVPPGPAPIRIQDDQTLSTAFDAARQVKQAQQSPASSDDNSSGTDDTPQKPLSLQGRITGEIVRIDGSTLVLDIGSAHGVTKGLRLIVYRDDQFIGYLFIESVSDEQSAGLLKTRIQEPRIGDKVIDRL